MFINFWKKTVIHLQTQMQGHSQVSTVIYAKCCQGIGLGKFIIYMKQIRNWGNPVSLALAATISMENWFSFSSSAVTRWLNIPGTGNERQVFWKADKFQSILRLTESRKGLVSHVSMQLDIFMPMIFVTPVIYVFFSGSIICLLGSNSEPHTMRIY